MKNFVVFLAILVLLGCQKNDPFTDTQLTQEGPPTSSPSAAVEVEPVVNDQTQPEPKQPQLKSFLALVGKDAEELSAVLGEPRDSGLRKSAPGRTLMVYEWYLPARNGRQSPLNDWEFHYEAAVNTTSGKVESVRADSSIRAKMPDVQELLLYCGLGRIEPELYSDGWQYGLEVCSLNCRVTKGENVVLIWASYQGSPIVKETRTDFATGEQSTYIKRSDELVPGWAVVKTVYIGASDRDPFQLTERRPSVSGTKVPPIGLSVAIER